MTKLGSDPVSGTAPNMWYNTVKYGRTLVPGQIYYYRAYAVVNGQTYCGEVKMFVPPVGLTQTLSFVDSSDYDIAGMLVGQPIEPIDVSGGVSGGLRMVLNAFIPFLVRRAERPPTARGRREKISPEIN